jgi:hypothetical protein
MPAYDPHRKRRSIRRGGAERGAWVFVPASELEAAGIDPKGPPPTYTTRGANVRGRRVIVNLYPGEKAEGR